MQRAVQRGGDAPRRFGRRPGPGYVGITSEEEAVASFALADGDTVRGAGGSVRAGVRPLPRVGRREEAVIKAVLHP
ncbi:hypothetical protein ABZ807_18050 [Micromonospora sp. NPDC047548]|uniref:hypothetical protein n=1 Tax=Micromonospora sp. NPDC047548 TaxID=3155624 RepID=UPI003402B24F